MDLETQFRECTRKTRYSSKALADRAIALLWLKGKGNGLWAYRCRVPGQDKHWHIGHIPQPRNETESWHVLNSLLSLTLSIVRTIR
jgi:hypothetical protein